LCTVFALRGATQRTTSARDDVVLGQRYRYWTYLKFSFETSFQGRGVDFGASTGCGSCGKESLLAMLNSSFIEWLVIML
jgi:hypothetical protein